MIYAVVDNGVIERTGALSVLFPHTSFPSAGPGAAFMRQHHLMPIVDTRPHNIRTHILQPVAPYLEGNTVYSVRVQARPPIDIAKMRDQLHEQRRNARTSAEMAGFVFQGKRIGSDRDSILRITQAALLASQAIAANQPFAVSWVCADDTVLELDAAGMLGMQQALTLHGLACHNRSQELRALIDAAEDGPALAAVALNAGWPE